MVRVNYLNNMEKIEDKKAPSEAQIKKMQEQYLEMMNKKKECWQELIPILQKHGYRFTCKVSIFDTANIKFDIDLVEGTQEFK